METDALQIQQKKQSLFEFFDIHPITKIKEIKTTIGAIILGEKQWWYLHKIFHHGKSVNTICFDITGTLFATGSDDCTARIFTLDKSKETIAFHHTKCINYVYFDNTGKFLATVTNDNKTRVFDIENKQRIKCYPHDDFIDSLNFDLSKKLFTSSPSKHSTTSVLYIKNTNDIVPFTYNKLIFSIYPDPTTKRISTGSKSCKAAVVNFNTGNEIISFQHDEWIRAVHFDPIRKSIATGSSDGCAQIFVMHDAWTLEQLLLKKVLHTWLLIEKPHKKINSLNFLLADVAWKCNLKSEELLLTWQSFPVIMRSALWRTIYYKIQQHGKV